MNKILVILMIFVLLTPIAAFANMDSEIQNPNEPQEETPLQEETSILFEETPYVPPVKNHAPILNLIGNKNLFTGNTIEFDVSASDLDGDKLDYYLITAQTHQNLEFKNQHFYWKPNEVGTYKFVFGVTDGKKSDEERVMITVTQEPTNSDQDDLSSSTVRLHYAHKKQVEETPLEDVAEEENTEETIEEVSQGNKFLRAITGFFAGYGSKAQEDNKLILYPLLGLLGIGIFIFGVRKI